MLKESFGATNNLDEKNHDDHEEPDPSQTKIVPNLNPKAEQLNQVYEPVIYSASDMEHNVEYEVNFLSEYSKRKMINIEKMCEA